MTEKELVSIVKAAIANAVEPLQLQIISQKELISDLQDCVEVVNNNLAIEVKQVNDTCSELDDVRKELKSIETLELKLISQKETNDERIAPVIKDLLNLRNTVDESAVTATAFEIKLLENLAEQEQTLDDQILKTADDLQTIATQLDTDLRETVSDQTDTVKLELMNSIQKEHLRLNNHVNNALLSLKGEKGDAGEQGEKGDSGFLSGVSKWETGCISKAGEAVTHDNAVWLCQAELSAHTPGQCDDYELIIDGVKSLEVLDGELVQHMTSGKSINVGRIALVHKGVYNSEFKYQKMDIVTIDKSSFLSMRDGNDTRPPSGSNDWLLLSGRGAKGTKGEKGDVPFMPEELLAIVKEAIDSKLGQV